MPKRKERYNISAPVQHAVYLSQGEDMRLSQAILKHYGFYVGALNDAIREAVADWCTKNGC